MRHIVQVADGSPHDIMLTRANQVRQPLLLVVGWVYNTQKTCKIFFAAFHRVHLVMHWEKVINIARGTTDPGYCLFNLSYLSS